MLLIVITPFASTVAILSLVEAQVIVCQLAGDTVRVSLLPTTRVVAVLLKP